MFVSLKKCKDKIRNIFTASRLSKWPDYKEFSHTMIRHGKGDDVHFADENVDTTLDKWQDQLEKSSFISQTADSDQDTMFNDCALEGTVLSFSELYGSQSTNHERSLPNPNVACLNDDQRRCYDIIDRHLQDTLEGKAPPQLLMFIPSEGGVGKSKVIRSMTENFE